MAKVAPSLPANFLDEIREAMPATLLLEDFIAACQRPLRRCLRVNTLKISVQDFLDLTKNYGWQLDPIPWCAEGFWLTHTDETQLCSLGNACEHLSGLFYIQEASSMLPVSALFYQQKMPNFVLDMAAAPGSKTTQIAASMNNHGVIIANEYAASRVKILHANISRCGVKNVAITHFDGRVFGSALPEKFDAILLDAPCSGEGVIRKDPHAMSNWSLEHINQIAVTQRQLIDSAFHALAPGGILVYSTCTLNKTENQYVIQYLLEKYGDAVAIEPLDTLFPEAHLALTPEGFLHVFPQVFDSEGFFVARLRKNHSVPLLEKPNYQVGKFPFTPLSIQEAEKIYQAAKEIGLIWQQDSRLWKRDQEIWLFPAAIEPLIGQVRFSRIGVKLADCFPKGWRWQHEAVIAFTHLDSEKTLELDAQSAQTWFCGQDIHLAQLPQVKECILTYQQHPLGIAKRIGNKLKNNLPRGLVRNGALDFHQ